MVSPHLSNSEHRYLDLAAKGKIGWFLHLFLLLQGCLCLLGSRHLFGMTLMGSTWGYEDLLSAESARYLEVLPCDWQGFETSLHLLTVQHRE
jgi:hypothetical protein